MEYRYQIGNQIKVVRVEREGEAYHVSIDGALPRVVRVTRVADSVLDLHLDGVTWRARVARDGQRRYVALGSDVYELQVAERSARRRSAVEASGPASLEAAMPGQVVSVAVREGDEVTKGQTLVILEAMKMELRVVAPGAGRVKRVLVETGQVVERGQQLVELGSQLSVISEQ